MLPIGSRALFRDSATASSLSSITKTPNRNHKSCICLSIVEESLSTGDVGEASYHVHIDMDMEMQFSVVGVSLVFPLRMGFKKSIPVALTIIEMCAKHNN